jgi:hypothetical protein
VGRGHHAERARQFRPGRELRKITHDLILSSGCDESWRVSDPGAW